MAETITPQNIQEWKDKIDAMSHVEMARLWRFAPAGHPVFRMELPIYEHFEKRYKQMGGMTPEISKQIGWQ